MTIAVLAALASALTFALGSALQHRATNTRAGTGEDAATLFARLAKRRSWLVGMALSAVAFSLHAIALSNGELVVVQPIIVSGIVFAVIIRAALDHRLPPRRVLLWLGVTWAGLAIFLAVRSGEATTAADTRDELWFVVAGIVLAGGLILCASRVRRGRGVLLGAAAGVLFGLVAGLLKLVTVQARGGLGQALTHWSLWVLVGVGIGAVLLNQRAYQFARLSKTAPVLNVAQVLVAIAFGFVVFGESFSASPLVVVAEVTGLALMGLGIWQLTVSQSGSAVPADSAPSDSAPAESGPAAADLVERDARGDTRVQ